MGSKQKSRKGFRPTGEAASEALSAQDKTDFERIPDKWASVLRQALKSDGGVTDDMKRNAASVLRGAEAINCVDDVTCVFLQISRDGHFSKSTLKNSLVDMAEVCEANKLKPFLVAFDRMNPESEHHRNQDLSIWSPLNRIPHARNKALRKTE